MGRASADTHMVAMGGFDAAFGRRRGRGDLTVARETPAARAELERLLQTPAEAYAQLLRFSALVGCRPLVTELHRRLADQIAANHVRWRVGALAYAVGLADNAGQELDSELAQRIQTRTRAQFGRWLASGETVSYEDARDAADLFRSDNTIWEMAQLAAARREQVFCRLYGPRRPARLRELSADDFEMALRATLSEGQPGTLVMDLAPDAREAFARKLALLTDSEFASDIRVQVQRFNQVFGPPALDGEDSKSAARVEAGAR